MMASKKSLGPRDFTERGASHDSSRALEQSEDQFRALAEAMPQFVWVARPDGTIDYFNTRWLEYTGLTLERMKTAGVNGVVHPEDRELTHQSWNGSLSSGKAYEVEYRLRRACDGSYRWFIARAVPVIDAAGKILRWIGTATDIDAQKRANVNQRFALDVSGVLSASLDPAAVCDSLASLAVKHICDWCLIVRSDAEHGYRVASIAHRNPERLRYVQRYRDRYALSQTSPVDRALTSNIPTLTPTVDQQELRAASVDAEHAAVLDALEMHSVMVTPIVSEVGTVYGAIMFVSSQSARTFDQGDLSVAQVVAERTATAIATADKSQEERKTSQRLRFIARVSETLFEALDIQTAFDRVTRAMVEEMADIAFIMRIEGDDALRTVSVAHRNPLKAPIAERMRGERTLRPFAEEQAIRMLSQHRATLANDFETDLVVSNMWDYLVPDVRALDVRSAVTVPLHSRGETYGALVAYWAESGDRYSEADLPIFVDLARRVSIAIDHALTLQRERRISDALQRALLPQPGMLPKVPGLTFSADYRPSSREADIGGDWYDALKLDDGSIVLSVGDVAGRGINAAGLMGKMRQALAVIPLYEPDPSRALDAVDFLLRRRDPATFATAFLGIIDPQLRTMRYASAGHPPALLRRRGEIVELHSEGLPLGLRDRNADMQREISLDGAELLVLYTDGLTEATRDISFGEARLWQVATSDAILNVRDAAKLLCDACLPVDVQDDTAVLAVQFGSPMRWAFDAENAQAARDARGQFVASLREHANGASDIEAAEVVFGELIGNVVRHAPGPIDVQLEWAGTYPVLHVTDRGRGIVRDPALPDDPLSECGRGLYIVTELARNLRFERIAGYGNHIAAELRLRRRGA